MSLEKYVRELLKKLYLLFFRKVKFSIILNYHRIGETNSKNPFHRLHTINLSVFKAQVRFCKLIGTFTTLDNITNGRLNSKLNFSITFDDVIDVVEAETTEDIFRFASVSDEEQLRGTILGAIRSRLPWLIVNSLTLSVAALVVWAYRDTIEQLVLLAAVMPVVAGLGGNAGTQALAVTIRRIALADETQTERWSAVSKELVVGLVNGLVIGGLVAVAASLIPDTDPAFGIVVMIAMWGNLIVASTLGAFFPIVLERIGTDPAVASSIFVTTFTDLFGFLLLLGLASAFLL